MGYLALYRRYRPDSFENLIGQDHIVKTLTNQIKSNRLGHAYLFTGTRGTGKTSAAKIFAKAINCLDSQNGSPCGKCEACLALSDPSNIDVLEIDAASNNGVNEIRELRENVQYQPVSCKYKVYIIDEVHMLTGAAFNALLKTLEEPPKHVVFILATTEVHKIPATILSRCMRFDFKLIPTEQIAQLISKIYDEQGKKYDKEAVYAIARAGEGSIRDALSIADIALSFSQNKLTYDDVLEVLGSSNEQYISDLILGILDSDAGKVLSTIDKLCTLGKSMGVLIKDVSAEIRNLLIIKTCKQAQEILMLPKTRFDLLTQISDSTNEARLLRILDIFADAENTLKYTTHPRVVFETASIKASMPQADYDIDALLSRIKTLEDRLEKGNFTLKTPVVAQSKESVEEKVVPSSNVAEKQEVSLEKIKLSNLSPQDLKGKLLVGLRRVGSEMLWNIAQGVILNVNGNVLSVIAKTEEDLQILSRAEYKEKIYQALNDIEHFELQIVLSEKEKTLDEIDKATERIKSIFGSDIVIIK